MSTPLNTADADPRLPSDFRRERSISNLNNSRARAAGIQINNIGKTSIVLLAVFSGLALGFAVFSYIGGLQSGRQYENSSRAYADQVRELQRENKEAVDRYTAQLAKSETETRMLEYYLLELDAKAIAAGIKRPEDAIANKLKQSREQEKQK